MKYTLFFAALLAGVLAYAAEPVRASRFGFDPVNATECLQKAIDSGAATVIIDNTGKDWLVDPLKLRSDLELVLAENVTVRARHDGFHGVNDCMFSAVNLKNVTVRGEKNARIFNQNDYFNKKLYTQSEWRHIFFLGGCENVTIRDLSLTGSGGDGVYIRDSSLAPSRNILLENLTVDQQGRQGVSVISAEKLRIRHCSFTNTKGASPEAGIDFEPNHPFHCFADCVVSDCVFAGNKGAGIEFMLQHFDETTRPVSILVENCRMERNRTNIIVSRPSRAPQGKIIFRNCRLSAPRGCSIALDFAPGFPVRFENVSVSHTAGKTPAISVTRSTVTKENAGEVNFVNTEITLPEKTPLFSAFLYPAPLTAKIGLQNFTVNGKKLETIPEWEKCRTGMTRVAGKPAAPDVSCLVSPAAGLPPVIRKNLLNFRNRFTMLLEGRKGEEITVQTEVSGVGKRSGSFSYSVTGPKGKTLIPVQQVKSENHTIRFTPEQPGLYRIDFKSRSRLRIRSEHRGQGIIPAENRFHFITPRGSLFFEVPAGVKEFTLVAWGDPGEKIAGAALIDPHGKEVCRKKNFDRPEFFTGKSSGENAELWEFRFDRAREDVSLLMLEPLNPVISERPDLLLRKK